MARFCYVANYVVKQSNLSLTSLAVVAYERLLVVQFVFINLLNVPVLLKISSRIFLKTKGR